MKTLLFLIPSHASFRKPIKETFEKMNWKVVTFDYRKGNLPIRITRFIPFFGGHKMATKLIDKQIINLSKKIRPSLILTVKAESLSAPLIKTLRNSLNRKIVNWFPEHIQYFALAKKLRPTMTTSFVLNP